MTTRSLSLIFSLTMVFASGGPLAPAGLRLEYLTNPACIDVAKPRFSWTLRHSDRGQAQSAYQVVVRSGREVHWDSGKVASPQSTLVEYNGPALKSGASYVWLVRYWDKADSASPYSGDATFDMGLLSAADWKAQWVAGGNNLLRKEFKLPSPAKRARAYVASAGYNELRINGHKVGNRYLEPGYTKYAKRVLYTTYDVTSMLKAGENAVGLMLGEGRFGSRQGIVQIDIDLENGHQQVVTDDTWRQHPGPLVADSVYNGETYDARKEMPGWDRPGFTATGWEPVQVVTSPTATLSASMMEPVRVITEIMPLKRTTPHAGTYIYDMGQNFSGWVRLKAKGPEGTRVRLRFAEVLYDDGTLNTENLRAAKATDVYILRGTGNEEVYEPRFTYHGFRYVEVGGYPGVPPPGAIVARVANNDVKPIGSFSSSNNVLNGIQRITEWGLRSNMHSVPTDCNQRDERMGWTADAHLAAESAILNFDMGAFYSNFVRDMRDEQDDKGMIPDTVPFKWGGKQSDPAWGSAYPLIISYLYDYYGDKRIIEENYDGMKKWLGYLRGLSKDGIVSHYNYGDWVPVESTPGPLVSTFYYFYSAQIAARAADILGKSDEAAQFKREAESIKTAFHKRFWNKETGVYGNGSQSSQILPLFVDLAAKEIAGGLRGDLANNIVYGKNTHLTTGILGTKYALPLLTRMGRSDLAYELASQTSYPSWGYMIERGATTLWELWQEKTGPSMNSHNHPMFGSIGAWFYSALTGINYDPAAPGFERIVVRPQIVRDLKWASGSIETQRGPISVSWDRSRGDLEMTVVVPVGSEAEVHIPKLRTTDPRLTEGGRELAADGTMPSGITAMKSTDGEFILNVGSGEYRFRME